jgi:hypothetical protein
MGEEAYLDCWLVVVDVGNEVVGVANEYSTRCADGTKLKHLATAPPAGLRSEEWLAGAASRTSGTSGMLDSTLVMLNCIRCVAFRSEPAR